MSSNVLECDICCNAFSEEYCPRLLPCSHTLCGHCIDGIIATNRKFCPSCRKEFAATSAEDLTVNRIVLDLIIQLSSKPKVSNASSSREPKASIQGREPKASASIQRFNEGFRKNCIKKGIKDYEETKAQVADAIESYRDMKFLIQEADKDIDGLMETLKGIKMSHSEMLSNIDHNIELMENTLDLAFQSKIKLENFDAQLASLADFTSAGPVIDEAETVFNEIQEKIRETQDLLKCERVTDIGKEILNTKINLDNIVEEMKRRRIQNDSQVNIKPSYLRRYGSLLRRIDPREIFVVKVSNGKQMVARIDIGANRKVSFTRLREGTLPPTCFILKLEDFLSMPSRRGFLDVSHKGTFLGRVIIKVIDEGNLALNFLHQCAGDLGSSYVNSCFLRSFDVENCVNIDGAKRAVLPGVDWQKEKEKDIYKQTSFNVGQVTAGFSNDFASRFFIITGNTGSWIKGKGCFGMVEEGLDVLRKAATYNTYESCVQVVDCGLMLSL